MTIRTGFRDRIASDFAAVMDNLEPITVLLFRNTDESVSITDANRSEMSRAPGQLGDVEAEEDDLQFSFPASEFVPSINAAEIRQRDEIVDADGVHYVVGSARLSVLQTLWNVTVRKKTG